MLTALQKVYFDFVEQENRWGKKKIVKVKKPLPPGLTKEEEEILEKAKRRAYRLDMALFSILGRKFGWSAVIGVLPGGGDFADLFLSLALVMSMREAKIPLTKQGEMLAHILLCLGIGFVPILGDYVDGVYKPNTRNVAILEKVLRERGEERLAGRQGRNRTDDNQRRVRADIPPPEYSEDAPPPKPARRDQAIAPSSGSRGGAGWFGGREAHSTGPGEEIPMSGVRRRGF